MDFAKKPNRFIYLYFIGIILLLFAGLRGSSGGDSVNYIKFYLYNTDTIWEWKNLKRGYAEFGFYYLSVLLKSISNDINFYFLLISLISMIPLLKSLSNLCLYPILGFIVYFARFFMLRNMAQIRAALAIAIVMYALKFLTENKPKKYTLCVLLAMTFHYSMIIALFFRFIYKLRVSMKLAVIFLFLSFCVSFYAGKIIQLLVELLSLNYYFIEYLDWRNLGIFNPVSFYQIFLCLLYFYFEKRLSSIQKGYYVIRNAYLFSTMILIMTSFMGIIGGRLATLFATCEIFIVPSLVYTIRPKIIGYIIFVALMIFIFYLNFNRFMLEQYTWVYKVTFN
jgi:hypothetical protein